MKEDGEVWQGWGSIFTLMGVGLGMLLRDFGLSVFGSVVVPARLEFFFLTKKCYNHKTCTINLTRSINSSPRLFRSGHSYQYF